ncbi:methyltransferase, FkbM family [Micromonospora matsumotoense]|uniref:Methyltransferase, FkbM family n=1 Tax=Micromonospora matsumotoense TaxID=121616 RepID=A0A1C5AV74_9ACTN|nr:FkbM family methyltransferase [Micromonospora matsumotoense]SCF49107.1 methyltransferase, FkbM family [Micromonospora matsumotoense]
MPGLNRPALTHALTNLVARHTRFLDNELPTMRTLVKRGDVCVDVGSAAGVYTQALSHLVGPSGLVHSVEPLSFSHPLWTRVLAAKERPNVRYHPIALGAEPGRMAMRVPFGPGGAATSRSFLDWHSQGVGSNDEFTHHADVMVDVLTLDGLAEKVGLTRLDFLKIDVEGGELHVLHGGVQTVEKYLPKMYMEIEERHTARYEYGPDDIVKWLRERGYTMYSWRNGWHATDRVHDHVNNYVFRVPPR